MFTTEVRGLQTCVGYQLEWRRRKGGQGKSLHPPPCNQGALGRRWCTIPCCQTPQEPGAKWSPSVSMGTTQCGEECPKGVT